MKPNTVHGITITGRERNAAAELHEQKRRVVRQWVEDYRAAGITPPPQLMERALELGLVREVDNRIPL